ncbi:MAG: hypothetical protein J7L23_03875 [Candidatus Diapherotrites archaeon]|nr:hypothetical protein [Candidatus Diapherotrites archaeon]
MKNKILFGILLSVLFVLFTVTAGADVGCNITLGSPADDAWTNDTTPSFNVSNITCYGSMPTKCYVLMNGTASGDNSTSIANNTGFSINANTSGYTGDGAYLWNITCTNATGGGFYTNTSATKILNIDTTPPSVAINTPTPDWYNSDFVVNATVTDSGSGVSAVYYRWENATTNLTDWISMSNSAGDYWNATASISSFPDGNYTIRILANDTIDIGANITNSSMAVNISLDTTPPNLSVILPQQNANMSVYQTNGSFWINGSAFDTGVGMSNVTTNGTTSDVNYTVNSGNLTNWAFLNQSDLAEGTYAILINATDKLGNPNTAVVVFTIDNTPPNFTQASPSWPLIAPAMSDVFRGNTSVNISAYDNITGVRFITFYVTYDNGTLADGPWNMTLYAGDANQGNWSIYWDSTNVSDDSYQLWFNITDYVGFVVHAPVGPFMVDNDRLIPSANTDSVIVGPNQTITFYANYSHVNSSNMIEYINGSCNISIFDNQMNIINQPMTFNGTVYNYTNTSGINFNASEMPAYPLHYVINCSNASYESLQGDRTAFLVAPRWMNGTVKYLNGATVPNVTITVTENSDPGMEAFGLSPWTRTVNSSSGGQFSIYFNDTTPGEYLIQAVKYNGSGVAEYTSPIIPPMPMPFNNMTNLTFYLVNASTIKLSAVRNGQNASISGMVFVQSSIAGFSMVMPVASFQQTSSDAGNIVNIVVPTGRNYTVNYWTMQSPPGYFQIDASTPMAIYDNSSYAGPVYGGSSGDPINLSWVPVTINGTVSNGTTNCTNFTDIVVHLYVMDGNVPYDAIMWTNITLNSTTGYYEAMLPSGSTYEISAYGHDNNGHYCMGRDSVHLTGPTEKNITLRPLYGDYRTDNVVNTSKVRFFVYEDTNNNSQYDSFENVTGVFAMANITYPDGDSVMIHHQAQDTPYFDLRLPVNSSVSLMMMSPRFSPRQYTYAWSDITGSANASNNYTIYIPVEDFKLEDPNSGLQFQNITIGFYTYLDACKVPNPSASCLIEQFDVQGGFDPMQAMMAGKVNVRMNQSSGVTVYYIGVDMVSSGPPDAQMSNQSVDLTSGSTLMQAWKLGSMAPRVYDYAIVGIPYDGSAINESFPMTISIPVFYDEDWNIIWNMTTDTLADVPTYYLDYNSSTYQAYINGTGVTCNASDENLTSSLCYWDKTNNYVWFKIPHFSGLGPMTNSTPIGTPQITQSSPTDGASTTDTTPTFSFKVSDTDDSTVNCSVYVDGSVVGNNSATPADGTSTTSIVSSSALTTGSHSWYIKCYDSGSNSGQSATWSFTITTSSNQGNGGTTGGVVTTTPVNPFQETYEPSLTNESDIVDLINSDENVQDALKEALGVEELDNDTISAIANVSAEVAKHAAISTSVEHVNGKSKLTLTVDYTGDKNLTGVVLVFSVPKSFAQSSDEITVVTEPSIPSSNIVVIQSDPVYSIAVDEFDAGTAFNVSFQVDKIVNRDTVKSDLQEPTMLVQGYATQPEPSETTGAVCGNSVKEEGEECDGTDGVPDGYKCTDNCTLVPIEETPQNITVPPQQQQEQQEEEVETGGISLIMTLGVLVMLIVIALFVVFMATYIKPGKPGKIHKSKHRIKL